MFYHVVSFLCGLLLLKERDAAWKVYSSFLLFFFFFLSYTASFFRYASPSDVHLFLFFHHWFCFALYVVYVLPSSGKIDQIKKRTVKCRGRNFLNKITIGRKGRQKALQKRFQGRSRQERSRQERQERTRQERSRQEERDSKEVRQIWLRKTKIKMQLQVRQRIARNEGSKDKKWRTKESLPK